MKKEGEGYDDYRGSAVSFSSLSLVNYLFNVKFVEFVKIDYLPVY